MPVLHTALSSMPSYTLRFYHPTSGLDLPDTLVGEWLQPGYWSLWKVSPDEEWLLQQLIYPQ